MCLHQPFGQGEAEARAGLPIRWIADLPELLEHVPLVLGRDPDAAVDHRDADLAGLDDRHDADAAAVGRVLDRV